MAPAENNVHIEVRGRLDDARVRWTSSSEAADAPCTRDDSVSEATLTEPQQPNTSCVSFWRRDVHDLCLSETSWINTNATSKKCCTIAFIFIIAMAVVMLIAQFMLHLKLIQITAPSIITADVVYRNDTSVDDNSRSIDLVFSAPVVLKKTVLSWSAHVRRVKIRSIMGIFEVPGLTMDSDEATVMEPLTVRLDGLDARDCLVADRQLYMFAKLDVEVRAIVIPFIAADHEQLTYRYCCSAPKYCLLAVSQRKMYEPMGNNFFQRPHILTGTSHEIQLQEQRLRCGRWYFGFLLGALLVVVVYNVTMDIWKPVRVRTPDYLDIVTSSTPVVRLLTMNPGTGQPVVTINFPIELELTKTRLVDSITTSVTVQVYNDHDFLGSVSPSNLQNVEMTELKKVEKVLGLMTLSGETALSCVESKEPFFVHVQVWTLVSVFMSNLKYYQNYRICCSASEMCDQV